MRSRFASVSSRRNVRRNVRRNRNPSRRRLRPLRVRVVLLGSPQDVPEIGPLALRRRDEEVELVHVLLLRERSRSVRQRRAPLVVVVVVVVFPPQVAHFRGFARGGAGGDGGERNAPRRLRDVFAPALFLFVFVSVASFRAVASVEHRVRLALREVQQQTVHRVVLRPPRRDARRGLRHNHQLAVHGESRGPFDVVSGDRRVVLARSVSSVRRGVLAVVPVTARELLPKHLRGLLRGGAQDGSATRTRTVALHLGLILIEYFRAGGKKIERRRRRRGSVRGQRALERFVFFVSKNASPRVLLSADVARRRRRAQRPVVHGRQIEFAGRRVVARAVRARHRLRPRRRRDARQQSFPVLVPRDAGFRERQPRRERRRRRHSSVLQRRAPLLLVPYRPQRRHEPDRGGPVPLERRLARVQDRLGEYVHLELDVGRARGRRRGVRVRVRVRFGGETHRRRRTRFILLLRRVAGRFRKPPRAKRDAGPPPRDGFLRPHARGGRIGRIGPFARRKRVPIVPVDGKPRVFVFVFLFGRSGRSRRRGFARFSEQTEGLREFSRAERERAPRRRLDVLVLELHRGASSARAVSSRASSRALLFQNEALLLLLHRRTPQPQPPPRRDAPRVRARPPRQRFAETRVRAPRHPRAGEVQVHHRLKGERDVRLEGLERPLRDAAAQERRAHARDTRRIVKGNLHEQTLVRVEAVHRPRAYQRARVHDFSASTLSLKRIATVSSSVSRRERDPHSGVAGATWKGSRGV